MINECMLATSPLVFSYAVSTDVTVETSVRNQERNLAIITIKNGSIPVWSTSLYQLAPTQSVPTDIITGNLTIKAGTSFKLTIPTQMQDGNVLMDITLIEEGRTPIHTTLMISSWPLSSAS